MEENQPQKEPTESKKQSNNKQTIVALARYSGMAFEIAAAVIIGLFLGKWLDGKFPMKFPVFTTAFTILGVFLGVYIVIRDLLKQK